MNAILQRIEDGTLARGAWRGKTKDGRETACLYAALVPGANGTADCPSHIMPQWVADLTPWIDDTGTMDRWPEFVRRYGLAQDRWHVLTDEQWAAISRKFRAECCIFALASAAKVVPPDAAYWPAIVAASEAISTALLNGDEPTETQRKAAAQAGSAARAARAGAAAVWEAVLTAAARAAVTAAAAATAATAAQADHLIDHFLTLVEGELE